MVNIEKDISDYQDDLIIKQDRLEELVKNKKELERINQKIINEIQILEDKEKAYKGSLEYIIAKERFEKAEKDFDSTQENLTKYKIATKKIQNATPELEKLQSKLDSLVLLIEKAEAYQMSNESCRELEKKLSEFRNKISAVNKIEIQIIKTYSQNTTREIMRINEEKGCKIVGVYSPIGGCGKTTILKTIVGILSPQQGSISIAQTDITHLPIESRNIGYVPQNQGLFPHLTVFENIAFEVVPPQAE